jgi:hypothetical protein
LAAESNVEGIAWTCCGNKPRLLSIGSHEFARMNVMASIRARPLAAGGIHAGNVAAYARAGADIVVTSSPYLAKPRDVQVRIGPVARTGG